MGKKAVAAIATLALALGLAIGLVVGRDDDSPKTDNSGEHPPRTDLLHVCAQLTDTFDETWRLQLGDDEEAGMLATKLQAMVDVGNREVAATLTPIIQASQAIESKGWNHAPERLRRASNVAIFDMAQTCRGLGTDVRELLGEN
jgi:hypothetical protein